MMLAKYFELLLYLGGRFFMVTLYNLVLVDHCCNIEGHATNSILNLKERHQHVSSIYLHKFQYCPHGRVFESDERQNASQ